MFSPARLLSASVITALLAEQVQAFYLPGAAPHDYHDGEPVNLYVNALTPMLAGTDNAKLVREFTTPLLSENPPTDRPNVSFVSRKA